MNSQDWADPENVRNLAISELAEVCSAMGLSWSASEKQFVIELPDILVTKDPASGGGYYDKPTTTRKHFDITKWGETGPIEGDVMPDDFQMPEHGQQLTEGEPPTGNDET